MAGYQTCTIISRKLSDSAAKGIFLVASVKWKMNVPIAYRPVGVGIIQLFEVLDRLEKGKPFIGDEMRSRAVIAALSRSRRWKCDRGLITYTRYWRASFTQRVCNCMPLACRPSHFMIVGKYPRAYLVVIRRPSRIMNSVSP